MLTWKHLNNEPLANQTNGTWDVMILKSLNVALERICFIFRAIKRTFKSIEPINIVPHWGFRGKQRGSTAAPL